MHIQYILTWKVPSAENIDFSFKQYSESGEKRTCRLQNGPHNSMDHVMRFMYLILAVIFMPSIIIIMYSYNTYIYIYIRHAQCCMY